MSSEDFPTESDPPAVRDYPSAVAATTDAKKQTRRRVLKALAGLGIGSAVFQRALAAQAEKSSDVTADMIQQAEWIAGLELSEADRKSTAGAVNRELDNFRQLRAVALKNSDVPAILFHPAPWLAPNRDNERGTVRPSEQAAPQRPQSDEELAFLPVTELAALIRTRQVSSVELTKLYLKRLQQYDPALLCVVTLTEELAVKQAERADREIAAGHYRGPLHGIPWGAKDLISVRGYKTTWGAPLYQEQSFDVTATVADRLERAGAVLVAKLSLGALAMGDRWFGGKTRNPWNTKQGSSGSSAGSARQLPRDWWGLRWAARRWAASFPLVAVVAQPACGQLLDESAATVACLSRGAWTKSARSHDRSRIAHWYSGHCMDSTGWTRRPLIDRFTGHRSAM